MVSEGRGKRISQQKLVLQKALSTVSKTRAGCGKLLTVDVKAPSPRQLLGEHASHDWPNTTSYSPNQIGQPIKHAAIPAH